MLNKICRQWLTRCRHYWFGQVETRPLSFFRLFFGLVVVKNVLEYLPLAEPFFSDAGIYPIADVFALSSHYSPSLLYALPQTWMVQGFFLLWLLIAIGFTIGYKTKWMAIANFLCFLFVHERNGFIQNGSDAVMHILSFWAMFVPLADHYALDARHNSQPHPTFAFPVRMLQLQVALIYLFTAILKLLYPAWWNGTALFNVLQNPLLTQPIGAWFFSWSPDWLLTFLTYFSLVTELVFMPLVYFPKWQPVLRLTALILVTGLQLGVAFLMPIINFQLAIVAATFVFWQPEWLQVLEKRFWGKPKEESIVPHRINPFWQWGLVAALSLVMFSVIWVNVRGVWVSLPDGVIGEVPAVVGLPKTVLLTTKLAQKWEMFSSGGPTVYEWISMPAQLLDGSTVDLVTGQAPDDLPPHWITGSVLRWREFNTRLAEQPQEWLLQNWAEYECRHFSQPILQLQFIRHTRHTYRLRGEQLAPIDQQKENIGDYFCQVDANYLSLVKNP